MKSLVDTLCALTSLICAVLLLRGFVHTKVRLLFWSGLCFVLFTVGNMILLIDTMSGPELDLSFWRKVPPVAGLVLLLGGMIFEEERK